MNLKLHRESRHWSQKKAASLAGVHVNTYARVEQGFRCDPGTAKKIAVLFGCSPLEFLPEPISRYQKHRYMQGLTLFQIAEMLGVDEHTVSRWESEKTRPMNQYEKEYHFLLKIQINHT